MTKERAEYRVKWRMLRWLLQLDQPIPARSKAEVKAEAQRNFRWNFWVNLLDGTAFWFGVSFVSSSTIMPLFISKLTTNPFSIGLIPVIAQAGWALPQLLTANVMEQLLRKKPVVVNLGFFLERLPFLIIAFIPLLALKSPRLTVVLFLLVYAWHALGAGIVATAWQELFARCFPVERRGSAFGLINFVGTGIGVLGGGLSAKLLGNYPFPLNFFYVFLVAAVAFTSSWVFLALTREPVVRVKVTRRSNRDYWAALPAILRADHNFRRYLITRVLTTLGGMGGGFLTVAALRWWQIPDSAVGIYTSVMLVGQTIGNLTAGFLSTRQGHKLNLVIGALFSALAFLLAWLAPDPSWYYPVFLLFGFSLGNFIVSGVMIPLEFCSPERGPTYIGLANSSIGLAGIFAPLMGALIAQQSYQLLFVISALFNLVGVIMLLWWVEEPRLASKQSL